MIRRFMTRLRWAFRVLCGESPSRMRFQGEDAGRAVFYSECAANNAAQKLAVIARTPEEKQLVWDVMQYEAYEAIRAFVGPAAYD